ncbi:protein argonaute 4B [Cajanus cajan]|uniref:Protein argonaute 4A n=1 Tax=Cajanus cajan TaxID=3821 RepID=A0A151SXZ7_CAJCA|nr:protein argonaute 4B [Cajanus cajan]KYP59687.1 Protein argonaute 4A [Cajanus cajan]
MEAPKRLPMARIGTGSKGQSTPLLSNHCSVTVSKNDGYFCHYNVAMSYDGDRDSVQVKGIGRKVLDEVCKIYGELKNLNFAYDGEKNLFTVGSLSKNRLDFTVVLEEVSSRVGRNRNPDLILLEGDAKRKRRQSRSKTIKVELNYVTKIPMKAIADALRGLESENFQEALRVLDIILRQHASNRDCLLVRQSFFHNYPRNRIDIGGGVQACRGFHSSFRATQGGLTLNIDVSNTIILETGPVLEFLIKNQNVNNAYRIDWNKAKRMLKNLRIQANGIEFKITGLSDNTCRNQRFLLRQKNGNGEVQESEITVYDYFARHKMIIPKQSADMPCINVGKPKRPCYFPIELCELVSLQRYTKALTNLQRTQLVTATRQLPEEKIKAVQNSLRSSGYNDEPMLRSCGITIQPNLSVVEGRVLRPPNLLVGKDEEIIPQNGRWNFNKKRLYHPVSIKSWAIVNFSSGYDTYHLKEFIKKNAREKGMDIKAPYKIIFEEKSDFRHIPAEVRVEKMYANVMGSMPERPQFLLCILPERKNSDLYGPWKRRCLVDGGVITQCIAPTKPLNDQYITNVLLKINAKFGGVNSFLSTERYESIPHVSTVPTLILGMDVSHGSPGRADVPSIAAVASSRCWPQITRYRATVRTQSSKVEMIQSLFKPVDNTQDKGIIREVLEEFTATANGRRKPEHIIIFRDGVSESQFNQVLNFELSQIIEACKHFDEKWEPKFALIVAQKNHHTRFFLADPPQTPHRGRPSPAQLNVQPGTIIDKNVCHPRNNDFYLCAQAGMIGTTRPTHYHVLHDEIGFTADEIQELVHSLSYTYQRSTSAVSLVAPVCYAHLAAAQMAQFVKFDEHTETSSSSHGGVTSAAAPPVPQLPRLHHSVRNSMFFC